jgi:hypothetical protein
MLVVYYLEVKGKCMNMTKMYILNENATRITGFSFFRTELFVATVTRNWVISLPSSDPSLISFLSRHKQEQYNYQNSGHYSSSCLLFRT